MRIRIKEIEEDGKSIADLRRKYDIRGDQTIQYWLKRYGRNKLLNKIVRIEMADEKDRIKKLEKEKRDLEKALSKITIQNHVYEAIFEVYAEDVGFNLKKNFGTKELEELIKHGAAKEKKKV